MSFCAVARDSFISFILLYKVKHKTDGYKCSKKRRCNYTDAIGLNITAGNRFTE